MGYDLADVRRAFSVSSSRVLKKLKKVAEIAERTLGELNGILFVGDPERSSVTLGPSCERIKRERGRWARSATPV
jgi:hypothetical protein